MGLEKHENPSGAAGELKSNTDDAIQINYNIGVNIGSGDNSSQGGTRPPGRGVPLLEELLEEPTPSITWVTKLEFGIDYMALTIFGAVEDALGLYSAYLQPFLGELEAAGESRFYEEQFKADCGFYLQGKPRIQKNKTHIRFVLPGAACQTIPFVIFKELITGIESMGLDWNCTRLDMRIDYCPFTPLQIAADIEDGKATTCAELATLKSFNQPLEKDELGGIGTHGMYLGARESARYLRIYDLHGFTRFELECKADFADFYFRSLIKEQGEISDLMMGYCMDYISLDTDYWRDFTMGYERAFAHPRPRKDATLEGFRKFLLLQCSIIFSVIYDIDGGTIVNKLLQNGRRARKANARYTAICHTYGID